MNRISITKFYSLLGLCCKAGKLVSGSFVSEKVIRSGKAHLVIISSDTSEGTKNKFTKACDYYNIDFIILGTSNELGRAIGKESRSIVAVTDENFKRMLLEQVNETNTGVIGEWQK